MSRITLCWSPKEVLYSRGCGGSIQPLTLPETIWMRVAWRKNKGSRKEGNKFGNSREREREREKRERKIPSFTIRSSSPRRKERKKRVKKIPPLPAGVLASKRDKRAGERERTRGSRGFCDARKSDAREFSRVTHISVGVMRQNTHEPFLQKKSWIVFDPSIHRNRQNGY